MAATPLAALVGRNIRRARRYADLTQGELAAQVGVSSLMAISRWERGEHRPSDESLVKLSQILGRDIAWFYAEHEVDLEAAA